MTGTLRPHTTLQTRSLLRSYIGWILLVTLLVTGTASLLTALQTPLYTASVNVLVDPRVYRSGAAAQAPDMGSEKQVATSGTVAAITAKELKLSGDVSELRRGLSVKVLVDTNVLVISYTHRSPEMAKERASGFAQGYLQFLDARNHQATNTAKDAGKSPDLGLQQAEVISAASLPTSPSSPNFVANVLVGLIVGACLGVGSAMLRDRLGDRLRSPADLEFRMAAPVLALVPRGDDANDLVMLAERRSPPAQAYRHLRAKVMQTAESRGAKMLVVTSSVANQAKSTVAANLAVALAQSGQDVVLVCADLQSPGVHDSLGAGNGVGLTSVLSGKAELTEAVRQTQVPRMLLLPPGPDTDDPGFMLGAAHLNQVWTDLLEYVGFIIVDAPALLSFADSVALAEFADLILMVEDAKRSTRRQVEAASAELEHVHGKVIGGALIVEAPRGQHRRRLRGAPRSSVVDHPAQVDQPPQLGGRSVENAKQVIADKSGLARQSPAGGATRVDGQRRDNVPERVDGGLEGARAGQYPA